MSIATLSARKIPGFSSLAKPSRRTRSRQSLDFLPEMISPLEDRIVMSTTPGILAYPGTGVTTTNSTLSLSGQVGLTAAVPVASADGKSVIFSFTNTGSKPIVVDVASYETQSNVPPISLTGQIFASVTQVTILPNGGTASVSIPLLPNLQMDAFIYSVGTDVVSNPINVFVAGDQNPSTNAGPPVDAGFNVANYGTPSQTINNQPTAAGTLPSGLLGTLVAYTQTTGDSPVSGVGGANPTAVVSGEVFYDANNSLVASGQKGLPGVTVTLAGVDDVGLPIKLTTTTDANGNYSFSNYTYTYSNGTSVATFLRPSNAAGYTITETLPVAGYTHEGQIAGSTGGTLGTGTITTVVPESLTGTSASTGNNFAEESLCAPTGISYTINGVYTTSLDGKVHEGDVVTATFTATMSETVTLVTYTATDSSFYLPTQQVFQDVTKTVTPGTYTFTVQVPNSYFQVDFVCGTAITQFNPSAGVTYHDESRFIDSANGGTEAPPASVLSLASISGEVYHDTNDNGTLGQGDTGVAGVAVQLSFTNTVGQSTTLTRVTDANGNYSFQGLQPGVKYTESVLTPSGVIATASNVGAGILGAAGSSTSTSTIGGITPTSGNAGTGYNFGELPVGSAVDCNSVQDACWWASCSGQNLIKSFNGGSSSTSLGNWLATSFPNLYGPSTGCNNLTGATNCQVASYFSTLNSIWYDAPQAQILATALNVYASTSSLGGNAGACYFTITATGLGSETVNTQGYSCLFGNGCGSTTTVIQLLQSVNSNSSNGVLFGGNCWDEYYVYLLFDGINETGGWCWH